MKIYKPNEFAEQVRVNVRTLYRWDETGIFPARKAPNGRRYYTDEDLKKYFGEEVRENELVQSKSE